MSIDDDGYCLGEAPSAIVSSLITAMADGLQCRTLVPSSMSTVATVRALTGTGACT